MSKRVYTSRPAKDRFEAKFERTDPDQCWEWNAAKNQFGHGMFLVQTGRAAPAHRVAYELYVGPIPADRCVMHACDNPGCVNPAHLAVGTYKENTADMIRKMRAAWQRRGESCFV